MSKICFITKKKVLFGKRRSYAMNKTSRKFFPNLHNHKFWLSKKKKFLTLKITTKALRMIDKNGLNKYIKI